MATFVQGETLTFVGSGATGVMLDTDSTGVGTGTYMTYGISAGNPAAADVITGTTSTATCILTSGTPDFTGVIWQGQQQNQEFSGAGAQLTISGSTASATAYKEYTTVPGASFMDNVNVQSNALRYNSANGAAIQGTTATAIVSLSETNSRLTSLQVNGTTNNSLAVDSSFSSTLVNFCILECPNTNVATTSGVLSLRGSTQKAMNTLVVNRASAANHIVAIGTGSPSFFNCTMAAADDLATAPTSVFLSGASGTLTIQNCGMFAGDATKALHAGSATPTYTTCFTDTNSPPAGVTQTTYANEFQDVNDATRDFRLKTGAAQIDTGTTDTTNAPIDIAKTNRPSGAAYDVGAWEFVQSVVGTVLTGFGRIFKGYG